LMSHLSQRPSEPAYYIKDCRILRYINATIKPSPDPLCRPFCALQFVTDAFWKNRLFVDKFSLFYDSFFSFFLFLWRLMKIIVHLSINNVWKETFCVKNRAFNVSFLSQNDFWLEICAHKLAKVLNS
jgi:hypothetical protein